MQAFKAVNWARLDADEDDMALTALRMSFNS